MADEHGNDDRDLNKNGRLDPFEDPSQSIEDRVEDLLGQMTLAEKAGLMFFPMTLFNPPFPLPPEMDAATLIGNASISHFAFFGDDRPSRLAAWHNAMQQRAGETRLGIPVTLASDPRHGFRNNPGAESAAHAFSQWPEPIGLAATGDVELVEQFANIARQEYLATGIRAALHPMADLATEPRWARINGTFGEDVGLVSAMVGAYIRGFQGSSIGPESVACMTKHFPGGGPQKDGEDPHFPYGREQIYPGGAFALHLQPFAAAFAAGTAQIMPYYALPQGTEYDEVGFAFNKGVITGLLRETYGFDGVVCADWGVLTDDFFMGKPLPARAWGVEHLTPIDRSALAIDAGVDQFGGEHCPELIVELVETGRIQEARIDESARRLLRDKFRLGLFDQPLVDAIAADSIVGNPDFVHAGIEAQRRSLVMLKNGSGAPVLPLHDGVRLYVEDLDRAAATEFGTVVDDIDIADVAILRIAAPFETRNTYALEGFFHAGSLAFDESELQRILAILNRKPTIVDITLDRPAVIPEIAAAAAGLIGSFGACDHVLLELIFGRFAPSGRLPFELPSSMVAVLEQQSDLPSDSANPLFPLGFGLTI